MCCAVSSLYGVFKCNSFVEVGRLCVCKYGIWWLLILSTVFCLMSLRVYLKNNICLLVERLPVLKPFYSTNIINSSYYKLQCSCLIRWKLILSSFILNQWIIIMTLEFSDVKAVKKQQNKTLLFAQKKSTKRQMLLFNVLFLYLEHPNQTIPNLNHHLKLTNHLQTYIVFFLLWFTFISFCVSGRLPLSLLCWFLRLQKFCDQIWTVQVVLWLPRVIFTVNSALKIQFLCHLVCEILVSHSQQGDKNRDAH